MHIQRRNSTSSRRRQHRFPAEAVSPAVCQYWHFRLGLSGPKEVMVARGATGTFEATLMGWPDPPAGPERYR